MPPGMFGDAEPAGVNVMTVQGKSTLTGSFTGDSTASLLNSAEADARIVVRQADQTLSAPMARLREDTAELHATVDLQACLRRLVKRTMYCELFPWCAGAPLHPADRMRLPVVLPTNGNCRIGVYSHSKAEYDVDFEESPYMWRCIPGKSLRLCRRCGLPAKCGLPVVWGYSIKVSPSGYACRDGIFVRAPTGKAIIPSTSTGWNQEIMPTGFSLEKCNEFASQRALGDTFGYVPKGTAGLLQHTQDDVRQWQSHIDASTSRMRYYLDETRSDLQHFPAQPVAIAAKAKLWPRLAAAKIQRAMRAHRGRQLLADLKYWKWIRLQRWGSTTIQCAWYAHVARAQMRRKEALCVVRQWISNNPAKQIQKVIRGHWGRVAFSWEIERRLQMQNIPMIQSAARRLLQRGLFISWWLQRNNPLTWQIPDPTRMRLLENPISYLHAQHPHPAVSRSALQHDHSQRGHYATCSASIGSIGDNFLLVAALNSPVIGKVAFASPVKAYDTAASGEITAKGESYLSFPSGSSPLRKQRFFGDVSRLPSQIKPHEQTRTLEQRRAAIWADTHTSKVASPCNTGMKSSSAGSVNLSLDSVLDLNSMQQSRGLQRLGDCKPRLHLLKAQGSDVTSSTDRLPGNAQDASFVVTKEGQMSNSVGEVKLSPVVVPRSALKSSSRARRVEPLDPAVTPRSVAISFGSPDHDPKAGLGLENRPELSMSTSAPAKSTEGLRAFGLRAERRQDTAAPLGVSASAVSASQQLSEISTARQQHARTLRALFDEERTRSQAATHLALSITAGSDDEGSESSKGNSVQSSLELKMWRKSSFSRIEHHQGHKMRLGKLFHTKISPSTTQKYHNARAKEADYDTLGGKPWPQGPAASSSRLRGPRVVPSLRWRETSM